MINKILKWNLNYFRVLLKISNFKDPAPHGPLQGGRWAGHRQKHQEAGTPNIFCRTGRVAGASNWGQIGSATGARLRRQLGPDLFMFPSVATCQSPQSADSEFLELAAACTRH